MRGQQMCFSDNSPPRKPPLRALGTCRMEYLRRGHPPKYSIACPPESASRVCCTNISVEIPRIHDRVTLDCSSAQQGTLYSGMAAKISNDCDQEKKEEKVAVQPEEFCALSSHPLPGALRCRLHTWPRTSCRRSSSLSSFLLPSCQWFRAAGKVVPSGPESLARNSFHRPNERFQPSAPLVHTWATLVLRFSECRSRGGSIESLVRTCCRMFHNGTSFSKISSFCRCTYLC